MYSMRKKSPLIPVNAQVKQSESRENSNVFDPFKFSPPNEFLVKLHERLNNYSPTKKN